MNLPPVLGSSFKELFLYFLPVGLNVIAIIAILAFSVMRSLDRNRASPESAGLCMMAVFFVGCILCAYNWKNPSSYTINLIVPIISIFAAIRYFLSRGYDDEATILEDREYQRPGSRNDTNSDIPPGLLSLSQTDVVSESTNQQRTHA